MMQSEREEATTLRKLLDFFAIPGPIFSRRPKVHDYTHYEMGIDYIFELNNSNSKGYMTAQGKGVRRGDHLLLRYESTTVEYQIEDINYYSSPANMWIALLMRV